MSLNLVTSIIDPVQSMTIREESALRVLPMPHFTDAAVEYYEVDTRTDKRINISYVAVNDSGYRAILDEMLALSYDYTESPVSIPISLNISLAIDSPTTYSVEYLYPNPSDDYVHQNVLPDVVIPSAFDDMNKITAGSLAFSLETAKYYENTTFLGLKCGELSLSLSVDTLVRHTEYEGSSPALITIPFLADLGIDFYPASLQLTLSPEERIQQAVLYRYAWNMLVREA